MSERCNIDDKGLTGRQVVIDCGAEHVSIEELREALELAGANPQVVRERLWPNLFWAVVDEDADREWMRDILNGVFHRRLGDYVEIEEVR